jgi:hypothetical protein
MFLCCWTSEDSESTNRASGDEAAIGGAPSNGAAVRAAELQAARHQQPGDAAWWMAFASKRKSGAEKRAFPLFVAWRLRWRSSSSLHLQLNMTRGHIDIHCVDEKMRSERIPCSREECESAASCQDEPGSLHEEVQDELQLDGGETEKDKKRKRNNGELLSSNASTTALSPHQSSLLHLSASCTMSPSSCADNVL